MQCQCSQPEIVTRQITSYFLNMQIFQKVLHNLTRQSLEILGRRFVQIHKFLALFLVFLYKVQWNLERISTSLSKYLFFLSVSPQCKKYYSYVDNQVFIVSTLDLDLIVKCDQGCRERVCQRPVLCCLGHQKTQIIQAIGLLSLCATVLGVITSPSIQQQVADRLSCPIQKPSPTYATKEKCLP